MIHNAFDLGITHFDLANNYGPPYGSAETTFGKILKKDLLAYRDEMIISTKAGYDMWPGPYGNWGSRKYLIASIDQSLKRMGLEYVDIFYHHRPDPDTPLEETMAALDQIVRSGKALYVGVSRYSVQETKAATAILKNLGTPFIIHQPRYHLFERELEKDLFTALDEFGLGCIVFSPLAQGILTDKYLNEIPSNSRAAKESGYLSKEQITSVKIECAKKLNEIAASRNQTLAQMAVQWVLRLPAITSALIGASRPEQIQEIVKIIDYPELTDSELASIDEILAIPNLTKD